MKAFVLAKFIILLLICSPLFAQKGFDVGLYAGNSDLLRKNDDSYYNYTNREYGVFFGKSYSIFQRHAHRTFQIDWRAHFIKAKYTMPSENFESEVTKGNVLFGIGHLWLQPNWQYSIRFGIGPGMHSGYYKRLTAGYYFTEELSFTLKRRLAQEQYLILTTGGMHNSNGNIYHVNRGLDLLFMRLGYSW
ncbi:MAG: acyloxyacyl hydrolase [Weeksellaceae bacterium]|nr:acyloxyacyl hydrolase [Weeksellaceae bacterium]